MTTVASSAEKPWPLSRGQSRRVAGWQLYARYEGDLRRLTAAWLDCPGDESLHDLRIALRRVRILLRVFEGDIEAQGGRTLRNALSRLGELLGRARDVDVMVQLVQGSPAPQSPDQQDAAEKLMDVMRQCQTVPLRAARKYLTGRPWRDTMAMSERFLARWAHDWSAHDAETIGKFLDAEFARHARRLRRSAADAVSTDPEKRHAFRIKLRRLRYLGDILGKLAGRKMARAFARVHRSEQQLGKVHDVDIAITFLNAHPALDVPGLREEWFALRETRRIKFLAKWPACMRCL